MRLKLLATGAGVTTTRFMAVVGIPAPYAGLVISATLQVPSAWGTLEGNRSNPVDPTCLPALQQMVTKISLNRY